MSITPTGAILPSTPPSLSQRRSAAPDSGFAIVAGPAGLSQAASARFASPVAHAGAMLALQEQAGQSSDRPADVADREARRHGQDMLEALAALQKALLAEADPALSLSRLTALAEATPLAHDPALARIVSAIQLRAKLEILRRTAVSSPAEAPLRPLPATGP